MPMRYARLQLACAKRTVFFQTPPYHCCQRKKKKTETETETTRVVHGDESKERQSPSALQPCTLSQLLHYAELRDRARTPVWVPCASSVERNGIHVLSSCTSTLHQRKHRHHTLPSPFVLSPDSTHPMASLRSARQSTSSHTCG